MKDDTNKFADGLLSWIKDLLSSLGIDRQIVERLDGLIYLVLILMIAFAVGKGVHRLLLYFVEKIRKYKKSALLDVLVERQVIRKTTRIIPPLLIISLLPFAFENDPRFLDIAQKITWIYFTLVFLIAVNTMLSAVGETVIHKNAVLRDRPMKGVVQIIQVFFIFMAAIVIISILVDKSPTNLLTGLGAFAALLLLIFRDSILGFVAGVLLAENDMIHIGDWIEMPQSGVNGIVTDITLTTVKVQNFDNTIVTVPPYSLISGSFTNWRGMIESGGRRIMRSYTVETDSIQACTPEFLEEMKKFGILKHYIEEKQKEQADGRTVNTDNPNGLVNGTIETNLGLFRAYMTLYLRQHPFISSKMLLMVRTLAPNDNGLPLQIYCFSDNTDWPSYESIQAEIMEHFVSVLPEFGLYAFQNASARDDINSAIIEGSGNVKEKIDQIYGIPWHTFRSPSDMLAPAETERGATDASAETGAGAGSGQTGPTTIAPTATTGATAPTPGTAAPAATAPAATAGTARKSGGPQPDAPQRPAAPAPGQAGNAPASGTPSPAAPENGPASGQASGNQEATEQ